MAWSYPLKNLQLKPLPAPLCYLIRPMLLISVGLHAILLLAPFPSEKPAKPDKKEDAVSLTKLPLQNQPAAKSSPAPPKTPPRPVVSPRPMIRPSAVVPRVVSRPSVPAAVRPSPPPQSQVIQPAPSPAADPFAAEFPHYPNAQPGSFGLPPAYDPASQKTSDAMSQVGSWFQQRLQAKEFTASPIDQPGRSGYQVSKNGKTKYLVLIPNSSGSGTNIVLSDQPLPEDLGSGRVVSPEEQSFYADLASIIPDADPNSPWQEVDNPAILPDPSAFYENLSSVDLSKGDIPKPRSGIERKVLGVGQTPQALFADLSNKLKIAAYEVTPKGTYGGGQLYQVTRDGITGFLNLVPTKDGASTAVFVWNRSPT